MSYEVMKSKSLTDERINGWTDGWREINRLTDSRTDQESNLYRFAFMRDLSNKAEDKSLDPFRIFRRPFSSNGELFQQIFLW